MANNLEQLEAALASVTDARQKIDLMNELSWNIRSINDERGLKLAKEAHQLAQEKQYPKGLTYSLIYQAMYEAYTDTIDHSEVLQALEKFKQRGDRIGQSRALSILSDANYYLGNYAEALDFGQHALKLAQGIGDLSLEAERFNTIGRAYIRSGHQDLGFTMLNKALAISRANDDRVISSHVLVNTAWFCVDSEKFESALEYAREGLLLCDNPEYSIYGYALLALGRAYFGIQAAENAMSHYQQALSWANSQDDKHLYKMALFSIGEIFVANQKPDQAIPPLQQSLTLAEEAKNKLNIFRCHQALSQAYENLEDFAHALLHYKKFIAVKEEIFSEQNTKRIQMLEVLHQTEIARREAEIYQLRNAKLEREITERKHLEEKLKQLTVTDELTGISNRRHFLELGEHHLNHAMRLRHPIALALIDIDGFKQINDTYGHAAGDRALVYFVKTVQADIRKIDLFARIGGDEFVLMLLDNDSQQAFKNFERIRQSLAANNLDTDGKAFSITITVGISSLAGQTDTLDALLKRADKALYRAKGAGRNRVEIEN